MRHELIYKPVFTVAKVQLEPGESVRAESGAMLSMSATIDMESKAAGGLGKMLGRVLGGESAFQTTFTARRGAGEVLLAPPTPGDVVAIELANSSFIVTSGCYLASDVNIQMETMASMKGFIGGEGLFMLRISGSGTLLVSSFGAVHGIQLAPGQPYIVDTGHLVAFSDGMAYQVKMGTKGLLGNITSGEGLVVELMGPGIVYLQTRTPVGFAAWMQRLLPH